MIEYKMKFGDRRTRKETKELLVTLARFGNHNYFGQFQSDNQVKKIIELNGMPWDRTVERCRNLEESLPPMFINYLQRTGVFTYGGNVELTSDTGATVKGAGAVFPFSYFIIWKAAQEAFERAVEKVSYGDFLAACVLGVASIEAYINHQALQWNSIKPVQQLIDNKESPIKFEFKIGNWPTIITGSKFDRGLPFWEAFLEIRQIRDHQIVHPKTSGIGITYEEMICKMNLFKPGINVFLVELHKHFKDRIDYSLVKAAFAPEIELTEEKIPLPI